MTDQITVPRATWDAMREALETIIQYNRDHARDQYGDSEKAERWACVVKAREAITAANAVSAEPCTHCGAIHAKGMNTLCDDGEPQAQGKEWLSMQQVDRIVYMCREDGQDTTYDIVNSAIQFYLDTHPQATEPSGWKLVSVIPTEEQWGGLARDIMMWMDMDGRKTAGSLFKHLERCGTSIPQWLRDEPEMKNLDHVPSKGTRATIIYRAMLAAAPEAKQ